MYKTAVRQLGWTTLNGRQIVASTSHNPSRLLLSTIEDSNKLTGDVTFMVVVGVIIMIIVLLAHVLVNTIVSRVVVKPIPIALRIPCLEVMLLGVVLVALSFYASMPLGPFYPYSNHGRITLIIHIGVCVPYVTFLCWLASLRSKQQAINISKTPMEPNDKVRPHDVLQPTQIVTR
jgi:hypothetical protein